MEKSLRLLKADEPEPSTVLLTFLFADIRGYTRFTQERGDEEGARLAAKFARIAREVVSARAGEVIELRGDEALAVFSSSRQALKAALDLQARFQRESVDEPELRMPVGIGLDAGEVIRVESGYRGGALNLGARLCGLAGPGEVLASEGVIHLARKVDGLEYAPRGTVELKGFADPVAVIQVERTPVAATQSPARDAGAGANGHDASAVSPNDPQTDAEESGTALQTLPFGGFLGALPSGALVARSPELAPIRRAIDAAAGKQGRLVLLAGEPGVGKTRLAQEATLLAHNAGFLVLTGRCYEQQQSVPYYPLHEVLSTAYAAAPPAIRSEASRRWPYLGRLLPDLLGSTIPAALESQEEQLRLLRAVTGFLQALAVVRPIALLLDDLQWADNSTVLLVQHLARHTRGDRVFMLGTYRDAEINSGHALEAALRDLDREALMERVVVRRLPEEGTAALIAETVGEIEAGAEFVHLLHERTDGNPFFTHQVLRSLIENGSVYRQDGRWERRAIEEIDVPESVRSVIGQRVSRLGDDAQALLRDASVLGPTFTFDDLLALRSPVADDPEDQIDMALTEASAVGLLRSRDGESYRFDHALTQQALYMTLLPRRRKRLHLAAGEALETLPERERWARIPELAWHFRQAGDRARALHYEVLVGDGAEVVFAHQEAELHYRQALELARELEDAAREAEVLERLGTVLRIEGRVAEALQTLETAAEMRREVGDLEAEAGVTAQIGVILSGGRRAEEGIQRLERLVERLEEREACDALARLYAALIRLHNRTGNPNRQVKATERLLELARGLDDERLLAEAEAHYGTSLIQLGKLQEALRVLEEAIRRSETVGDLPVLCQALDAAALAYLSLREPERVMAYRERAVQIAEQLADPREASFRAVEVTYVAFLLGDWIKARSYAERSLTHALSLDDLSVYLQPLHALGELCLYGGQSEDAAGYLREFNVIAEHLGAVDSIREAQGLLAEVDILNGDGQTGLARLEPLLDTPGWSDHLNFLLPLAWAYLETGRVSDARDAASKALAEARAQRVPVGIVEALRVDAMIASRQGEWPKAEELYTEALDLSVSIRYPWGEARALFGLGLMRTRTDDRAGARAALERARAVFTQLGAKLYEARAEKALQDL